MLSKKGTKGCMNDKYGYGGVPVPHFFWPKGCVAAHSLLLNHWQGIQDLNLYCRSQSAVCYHYTNSLYFVPCRHSSRSGEKERNSEPLLTGDGLYNTTKIKEVFHIRKCPSFLINFIFILIYFAVNVKRYFWEGKFRCILQLWHQAHRRFFQDLIVSASSCRFHMTVSCWPIVLSCLQAHTWRDV